MALTFTLLVDQVAKTQGSSPDSNSLAREILYRAAAFGEVDVSTPELAGDIESGFDTVDLRLRSPQITVQVSR